MSFCKTLISPSKGGYWYCHTIDDNLVFSWEWDSYVHLDCIRNRLDENPSDREALIFAIEFDLK